ncbi:MULTISPECIES: dTDP-4-dehydrorhamnose reductase [unclassified Bosea (in: a-proteobacteria)]|uniref:dTDP-4-dehydrorhamnose reductase n=1 Tax=unclassified Bosea (in: a-proteobacteria) TaxID=2653178 RepID=UPI000F750793|nr:MULTISPECIES: dTDP-4-dehydrorhamnose reductase [unclassified Bosea (in: a-proteobacteria)]AZO81028.1 dTDP-4-dehydrorhamnose reductase [Bosea sp. Tri-49]RXT25996.1 dTDP-4-dehydrorhamnose reductase [Bosea sp. Tri-39]RXT31238.1 dTDP-4-dehydrorhamnose reductase [Bosea sp. Tri-54]
MRIAVTGRTGQVVQSLLARAETAGVTVIPVGRPELDLAQPEGVRQALSAARPDCIVNAAAYTAVDKAETEPELALRINSEGAGAVAAAAVALGVPLIQISTDYVFDGMAPHPWRESDATAPLSAYGRSKLAGEEAVIASGADWTILRTAWVYSPYGANFVKTMLRLAESRDEIGVVSDQLGSPTSALDLADAIIAVAKALVARPDDASLRGVFHAAGTGEASWADLAETVFVASAALGGPSAAVRRITTLDYPTPARRPTNSRLDCSLLIERHGLSLPLWQASVKSCVATLLAQPRS